MKVKFNGILNKILVINFGGVGDLLLSIPALRAVKEKYPSVGITLLTTTSVAPVARRYVYFNEVVYLHLRSRDSLTEDFLLNNWWHNMVTLLKLRIKQYDLTLNMRTIVSTLSAFKLVGLLLVIGGKYNVGWNTAHRGWFFDFKVYEPSVGTQHESAYHLDLVKLIGVHPTVIKYEIPISETERKYAQEFIFRNLNERRHGQIDRADINIVGRNSIRADLISTSKIGGGKVGIYRDASTETVLIHPEENTIFIGFHPGGAPSRRWPTLKFVNLAKEMVGFYQKYHLVFVLTGSSREKYLTDFIFHALDSLGESVKTVNTAGRLTLMQTAAIIERMNVYVTNDTGTMHIAAIVGTPVVAIFGPGQVKRYDPRYISPRTEIVYHPTECAPCDKFYCQTKVCLTSVTVPEVFTAVAKLLENSFRGPKN